MANIWGAVIGGVAGGILGGAASYITSKQRSEALQKAADDIRAATNEYSGIKANTKIKAAGDRYKRNLNNINLPAAGRVDQTKSNLSNLNWQNANSKISNVDMAEGMNLGRQNETAKLNAQYDAATAKAQRDLEQANINTAALQQGMQAAGNVAGGLAKAGNELYSTYKNAKAADNTSTSDENAKESINNDSGLPESDIEDSLRQLETVQYKYKDPNVEGCDNEIHKSGFTAQSLEKTPLGKDVVSEGEDGYKRIDQDALLMHLMDSYKALTKELQELRSEQ